MTKLYLAVAGAAALALAGCNSSNSDAINATDNGMSADLNAGASDAASDAANAEADALGNQEAQLEQENMAANPNDADEQNVAGM